MMSKRLGTLLGSNLQSMILWLKYICCVRNQLVFHDVKMYEIALFLTGKLFAESSFICVIQKKHKKTSLDVGIIIKVKVKGPLVQCPLFVVFIVSYPGGADQVCCLLWRVWRSGERSRVTASRLFKAINGNRYPPTPFSLDQNQKALKIGNKFSFLL